MTVAHSFTVGLDLTATIPPRRQDGDMGPIPGHTIDAVRRMTEGMALKPAINFEPPLSRMTAPVQQGGFGPASLA